MCLIAMVFAIAACGDAGYQSTDAKDQTTATDLSEPADSVRPEIRNELAAADTQAGMVVTDSTEGSDDSEQQAAENEQQQTPVSNVSIDDIALDCREYSIVSAGSYAVENNMWGKQGISGPYYQCTGIGSLAGDGSVSARWTWDWPSGPSEVKGFPQIIYGQKPGYEPTQGTNLPMRVNAISTASSKWSTQSTFTGTGQLTYDLWLTNDANRHACFNCAPITHEIMVALEPYGGYGLDRNPAWYIEETWIDGIHYKLYKADNFGTIGWRFIVLQSQQARTEGTIDFKPVFAYLKQKGLISGEEYLSSVEFGTEPEEGSGDVLVKSFSVIVD